MQKTLIMLVDDEPNVLTALQRLLRGMELEISALTAPAPALDMLRDNTYALIVCDYRMPGMDGVAFLEQARAIAPDTVRYMLSGYADLPALIQAINRGAVTRFLTKPWNDDELRLAVRHGIAQYELVSENRRLHVLTGRQNVELKELNRGLEVKVRERTAEVVRLNADLREGLEASVRLLGEVNEMHSTVVGRHAKRVAQLARDIASVLDRPPPETAVIETAAMLHDIGKIGVPSVILAKSEKNMTTREHEAYKSHAVKGEFIARLLPAAVWCVGAGRQSDAAEPADDVPSMIRHHHERFDGRGYPDQLRGEKIPFGARVIAVADAYDRFLNNRESFSISTPTEAVRQLQARGEAWYDPALLAALAAILNDSAHPDAGRMEVEIRPGELRAGMVLSRELRTPAGMLLLAANTKVEPVQVERLLKHFDGSPLGEWIYIYRR